MSGRFASRAAVVTGAGQGIGREIARQLALEGARVLLNDRDEDLAREAARAIGAEGGVVIAAGGDVSEVEATRGLVERAVVAFGRLDLAVANAGITLHCDFLDYRPEDFDRLLAVNLRGSFFLAQAAARRFREQATPGRILFLSSVTGHMAIRQMAPYGMTKSALEALARNLSLEMAPHGITVNAVAPGATITPRTVSDEEWEGAWAEATPNGRVATGADVAAAALFLLSDAAVARHRPEPGRGRRLDRDGRGAGEREAVSTRSGAPVPEARSNPASARGSLANPLASVSQSPAVRGCAESRHSSEPCEAGLPQSPAKRTRRTRSLARPAGLSRARGRRWP